MSYLMPYLLAAQGELDAQAADSSGWQFIAFLVVCAFAALILFVLFIAAATYGKLWFQAYMSQADISMLSLIGMGFRQVKPTIIVTVKVMCAQAGLSIDRRDGISTSRLEAHYLAGGDVRKVAHAIIAACPVKSGCFI